MSEYQLPLNEANRAMLRRAFAETARVDIGIEAIIDFGMGSAWADHSDRPTSYMLQTGPFTYFAGEFDSPGAIALVQKLPPYMLMMACPPVALAHAREHFGRRLVRFVRYRFSSEHLSLERTERLLAESSVALPINRLDHSHLQQAAVSPDHFLDTSAYRSPDDFLTRGGGYGISDNGRLIAAAYASLATDAAVEVSIYVEPEYRRRGMAAALGARLIRNCLRRGLEPHWDAANLESCSLAEKLGYAARGTYDAYYVRPVE